MNEPVLCLVRGSEIGAKPFLRYTTLAPYPMLRDADETRGLVRKIEHVPGLGKCVSDFLQPQYDDKGNLVIAMYPWGIEE